MLSLNDAFKHANDREFLYLKKIKENPNHNIFRIASTLRADGTSKFLFHLYEEKCVENSKQDLYTSQKLLEFMNSLENNKYFPTQLNKLIFLCSDSQEIIENFKNFNIEEIPDLQYKMNQGHTLGFVVQQILVTDYEKAIDYLNIFKEKSKKSKLQEAIIETLEGIIEKDENTIARSLEALLLPKYHNQQPDKGMISHGFISFEATVLAKISWLTGIEVDVTHKLLPNELLPINPNEEYIIEYDFLKSDYDLKHVI